MLLLNRSVRRGFLAGRDHTGLLGGQSGGFVSFGLGLGLGDQVGLSLIKVLISTVGLSSYAWQVSRPLRPQRLTGRTQ